MVITIMRNKRKKILILGATGFIGRNLVEKFSSSSFYDVHAVRFSSQKYNLKGVTWHRADLRKPEKINKIISNTSILIQAAATTSGSKDIINRPYIHVTDNIVMNSYILKSAFEHKIEHLIFFSCSVMYHKSKKALKESDFDPNKKMHPNYFSSGNTKLYIEKLCEFYSTLGVTKFTAIRHSNIYGQHDKFDLHRSHFFGATISKVMTSNNKIVVWGQGLEQRDLLHVDDLVNFVELVLKFQKQKFKIYNCGYGKAFSVKNIVKKIIIISEKKLKIQFDKKMPSINTSLFLNCKLAYKELGWKPIISLDKGIKKTIIWWKQNINKKTLNKNN